MIEMVLRTFLSNANTRTERERISNMIEFHQDAQSHSKVLEHYLSGWHFCNEANVEKS